MQSRRRPWKAILICLLVTLFLGMVYARTGLVPGQLRERVTDELQVLTGKKIVFDRILFIPFHGFSFIRPAVFEKDGSLLFKANRVTVNARLIPFIREKKIVIDRLLLDHPVLDWSTKYKKPTSTAPAPKTVISGQIEVPVAGNAAAPTMKNALEGPDYFLPENVYIERIEISEGKVTLRPSAGEEPAEILQAINIRLTLPHPPVLRLEGRVELGKNPYGFVQFAGVWDLERIRYEFNVRAAMQRIPQWMLDFQKSHFLRLQQGAFSVDAKVFGNQETHVFFKTQTSLREAVIQLPPATYSGKMRLEAEGVFDSSWNRFLRYKGTLSLLGVRAERLSAQIESLDDLSGHLDFEPDLLKIRQIKGVYKKIPFEANGTISSFKELKLLGEIRSRLTVDEMLSLIPEQDKAKLKGFAVSGECLALTRLSGSIKKGSQFQSEHRLVIQNGSLRNDSKRIKWENLSGEIEVNASGITVEHGSFFIDKKRCQADFFLPKKPGAKGWFKFSSDELRAHVNYTIDGERLQLLGGSAALPGAQLRFKGSSTNWSMPYLSLSGQAWLDLEMLLSHQAKRTPGLSELRLAGKLSGPFQMHGVWNRPIDWDLKTDLSGSRIRIQKDYILEEVTAQLRLSNQQLSIPLIRASCYGGSFGMKAQIDLAAKKPGVVGDFYLNSLDLKSWALSQSPPKQDLSGTLIGKAGFKGYWGNPSSFTGNGAFSVTRGSLWKTDRFKAMGKLPLVKVEGLDWVTFEEASATFEIRGGKFHTDDLTLLGDSVDLSMKGTIGFDRSLDLIMNISYSDEIYQGADITGGIAPFMVQEASNFISQYHIHGNMQSPVFEKMLLPSGRSIGRRLTGILKGIATS